VKDISNSLKIEPADELWLLTFSFLEFRFFWNSENGKAMFFGNPRLLKPLIVVPYMLAAEAYNFGAKKHLVRVGNHIAAIFVLKAKHDTLIVNSLAVSPDCRRFGIGFFILEFTHKLCRQMEAKWLELTVLKSNTTAQRLYQKFGFKIAAERKFSLVLRKEFKPEMLKRKDLGSSYTPFVVVRAALNPFGLRGVKTGLSTV
jgi:GNAT superfamily N-acetyltransferase